jgi:hypothetical protein
MARAISQRPTPRPISPFSGRHGTRVARLGYLCVAASALGHLHALFPACCRCIRSCRCFFRRIRASPTGRRIWDAQIVRAHPFASARGRPNSC